MSSTYYQALGGALPDYEKVNVNIGTFKLEHDVTNDIKLTNTTRYTDVNRDTRVRAVQLNATNIFATPTGGAAVGFPVNGANLNNYYVNNTNHFQHNTINRLLTNQTDLVAKFNAGFLLTHGGGRHRIQPRNPRSLSHDDHRLRACESR